jgi:hypothetical protein
LLAAVGIALTACQRAPSPTVFLDPALAVLVPRDTTLLAGIRMQRLRSTSFYSEVASNIPRLTRFRDDAGLQDDADVWEYLIASNGSEWVALMRGKFSEMGMEPRSKKTGARRISHGGVSVIGDERGSVAFLNPTTAIAGSFDAVKRALDERNSNTGVPDPLERLASGLSSSNEAWLVSIGPAPGFVPVPSVATAAIGLNPQSRTFEARIEANSEADAAVIAREIGGGVKGRTVTAAGAIPERWLNWFTGK